MAKFLDKLSLIQCDDVDDLCLKDVQWMWEVQELTPYLDWFAKYVDESNCISHRQFQKFCTLSWDGKELSESELDQALEECGLDITNLNLFEDDLELCNQEVDLLRAQYESASEVEALLNEENQKLLSDEETKEKKLKVAQVACQREGQNLMRINVPLKAAISGLFSSLSKLVTIFKDSEDPDILNCCISNMPLESTLNVVIKFNEYANLCLKRKFEQSSYSDKNSVSDLMSYLEGESSMRSLKSSSDMTSDLPNKMWKADINRIASHGTLMGYAAAIRHLQSLCSDASLEKLSHFKMKLDIDKLQDEISRLSEDISLILKHEVSSMVEDRVLCTITTTVERITRSRIERRQQVLTKLCSVANVTNEFLCFIDVVWMLIYLDCQRFKHSSELLKEISDFFTEELNIHQKIMSGLNTVMNNHTMGADNLKLGQALLLNTLQRLLDSTIPDNDSGNGTYPENRLRELESIQASNSLDLLSLKCPADENTIYELLHTLSDGPTKKPNLVKKEISFAIHEIEAQLKQYCNESTSLATHFSSMQMLFKKSPVTRNRRLLWAWFLVAPDKLKEAIDQAEDIKT